MLTEPQEMVEPFGRFREVPRTVPPEPGDIALHDRRIQRAHGIAMPVEPSAKRVTGASIALDTAGGVTLAMERGGQVVQIRTEQPLPQAGDHVRSHKEVFEHTSLLFLEGAGEKKRIARLDHAEEGEGERRDGARAQRDEEGEHGMIRYTA